MFLGYRLERKEEEILGEVLQALQHEKDRCKSLETQVWAHELFIFLNMCCKNRRDRFISRSLFSHHSLSLNLMVYISLCVPSLSGVSMIVKLSYL